MEIKFNQNLEREIFLKYIRFERHKGRRVISLYYVLLAIGVFIFSLGMYVSNPPLWLVGLVLMMYPLFLLLLLPIKKKIYLKQLNKLINLGESGKNNRILFSFDESCFTVANDEYKLDTNYSAVKRFDENDGDLYLFSVHDELMNIISKQKIGSENYSAFRNHLINGQKNNK